MVNLNRINILLLVAFWVSFFLNIQYANAQSLSLYTPFTKVTASPGDKIDFQVEVLNNSNVILTSDIRVNGLPENWEYEIKSGSWSVERISVKPKDKQSLTFHVFVPLKVEKGNYNLSLIAGNSLPIQIELTEEGTYKTEFSSSQLNVEGAVNSTFTYNTELYNRTADVQVYAFRAQVPSGWNAIFKSNNQQVSSVTVDPNEISNITIEVTPAENAKSGKYEIPITASNGQNLSELILESVVTGSYDLKLSSESGLLSDHIRAGNRKQLKFQVKNTGSSVLNNVQLNGSAPANWEISFEPSKINKIGPGESQTVLLNLKASNKALSGDYLVDLEAKVPEKTSKVSLRVTVKASLFTGWLGLLIIFFSIYLIYYLFKKYGRR